MMEHTTDRLFWTLTSVIVGALLLTIGIKAFPQMAQQVLQPVSGIMKQADTANGHVSDAANQVLNDSEQDSPANNHNMNGTTSTTSNHDDINIPTAQSLGMTVQDNGDGTGTITNFSDPNGTIIQNNGTLNIPEKLNVNGNILTITQLGPNSLQPIVSELANRINTNANAPTAQQAYGVGTISFTLVIPDTIQPWSTNNMPITDASGITIGNAFNIKMSDYETNKIIPNGTTLVKNNVNANIGASAWTNMFPSSVIINGTINGWQLGY